MGELSKRSTVYFKQEIHQALKIKAAITQQSISQVVNEAIRIALIEDNEDLEAFTERADEPVLTYETLLADLKSHGKI